MNWKYWYQISQKIENFKQYTTKIQQDTDYLQLQLHDYFLLNSIFSHTKPKNLGYIGGFSNLDFFIPQYEIDCIEKCTNFDGTIAGKWCSQKQTEFAKQYKYSGEYTFVNEDYSNIGLENADFLYLHINVLPTLDLSKLPKLKTSVLSYYGDCMWYNLFKNNYNNLPKKIITSHLVVYTNEDCLPIFKDCEGLRKTFKARLAYKNTDAFQEDTLDNIEYNKTTEMAIRPKPLVLTWDEKLDDIKN